MKRSTERILTTHVGSLSRPDALVPILKSKDRGQPYDRETYDRLVRDAVADVVRKQTEAGVDVVTDGEQGKASFFGYIVERFDKTSLIPARILEGSVPQMRRKGRIAPDMDADLVVFDLATIADRATYEKPAQISTGIRHVIVAGVPVIENGTLDPNSRPGRPVRRTPAP